MERRKNARLVDSLPVHISHPDFSVSCRVLNISSNGLLCESSRDIPVMTKIQIILVLPPVGRQTKSKEVKLEGVVVRSEEASPGPSRHLAIYITDLSKTGRQQLDDYIRHKLSFLLP